MILLFSLYVFVCWSMNTFRSGGGVGGSRSSKVNLRRAHPMKTEYAFNSSFSIADDFAYFGPAVIKCTAYIV